VFFSEYQKSVIVTSEDTPGKESDAIGVMMWVYLEQLIVEKNNEKQQKIVSSGENN
jgi:hypothetical protein